MIVENQSSLAGNNGAADIYPVGMRVLAVDDDPISLKVLENLSIDANITKLGSTQKRPRVVWSVELHRTFVVAVHQLGVDKVVPKKILDLMNVEGLKRENVASHLQKYRLYLQRISNVAAQQASIAAALGVKDASYMQVGKLDGFGDLCSLAGNGSFANAPLSSFPPCAMIGRLNSLAGLTLHGITSSRLIQHSNSQNLNNPVNTPSKIEPGMLSSNKTHSIFEGIPTPLQLGQLQPGKSSSVKKEFTLLDDSTSASPLIRQGNTAQIQSRGDFGAESSAKVASLNQDSLVGGINGSSHNIDHNQCDESWNAAFQMSKFPSNPFENYSYDRLTSNNMCRAPIDLYSTCAVSDPRQDSIDERHQQGLIGNFFQTTSVPPKQRVEENKHGFHLNHNFRALDCIGSGFLDSSAEQIGTAGRKMFDVSSNSHLTTGGTPSYAQDVNNLLHQAK